MRLRTFIVAMFLILSSLNCWARRTKNCKYERPVMASYYLKLGGAQLKDTYLSVVPYKGLAIGGGVENIRTSRFGEHQWDTRHLIEAEFSRGLNQYKNRAMLSFMLNYEFDYYRRYTVPCGLNLYVGGNLLLDAGCTYSGLGNNPAAAKASLGFGISAMAVYKLKIKNYTVTIKDNLSLPMAGLFFCPQYGASYYEVFYLGNREGWLHFGYPGNNLYISNMLTLDLPVKRRAIRIGYQCKFRNMNENHLKYQNFSHEFILGVAIQKVIVNARGGNNYGKKTVTPY